MNYRSMTFLMYLTNVSDGGETIFPFVEKQNNRKLAGSVQYKAGSLDKTTCKDEITCTKEVFYKYYQEFPHCCCSEALKIYPQAGRAILFFPRNEDGETDKRTWHGGCPVVNGSKFTAQQWVHSDEIVTKGNVKNAKNDVFGLINNDNLKKYKKKKKRKGEKARVQSSPYDKRKNDL